MILFRYFTREILGTFIVISLILLLIFISNQFAHFLKLTAAGKILGMQLLHLMVLEIPQLLSIIFPLAFYLSVILTYGRLYVDSEMVVLSACGLSPKKLLGMTFIIASFVAIPVFIFTLFINPIVANTRDRLLAEIGATSVLQTLQPGRFQQTNDGARIFYIEKMSDDKNRLENVFVAEKGKAGSWNVMSASGGHHEVDPTTHDRFVVADDGYRYQGIPGTRNFTIIHFDHYGVRINLPVLDRGDVIDSIPTLNLLFPPPGQRLNYAAELQWRLSMPLCIYILTLIAFSLSYVKPRQGRFGKLFPAILIYIIYANFMIVGQDWISGGDLTPKLGLWVMHLFMLGVGFLLYANYTRMKWIRRS
ncbi:MAG TPA: LPS export ABC transporter permease LptF [Gammaproteobacteria bacterium]|nr:LPS export ABC transporter permease LptF [Gammaproteobacteria bacterium]